MEEENKKFRILSIDGGGIRGLIPARVLAELEEEFQQKEPDKKLYEHFDLICGTSTGAILAIGCLLYTSPSPRDKRQSRMPSSA